MFIDGKYPLTCVNIITYHLPTAQLIMLFNEIIVRCCG